MSASPEARLLVVEDEPNILELLSASLRLAGTTRRPRSSSSSGTWPKAGSTSSSGGGGFGASMGGSDAARQIAAWVEQRFTATTVGGATVYDLTGQSSS